MAERLTIMTRLDNQPELYKWILGEANKSGISISGWIRMQLIGLHEKKKADKNKSKGVS